MTLFRKAGRRSDVVILLHQILMTLFRTCPVLCPVILQVSYAGPSRDAPP